MTRPHRAGDRHAPLRGRAAAGARRRRDPVTSAAWTATPTPTCWRTPSPTRSSARPGWATSAQHFPDTDPRWRGRRLARAAARGRGAGGATTGWTVAHVDATVMAERPKLAPVPRGDRRLAGRGHRRQREHQGHDRRADGLRRPRGGHGRPRRGHARARVKVRRAEPRDADAIAAVWLDAWRTAYRGLVPGRRARRALARRAPRALARPARPRRAGARGRARRPRRRLLPHAPRRDREPVRRPRGRGVGSALLTAALAGARHPRGHAVGVRRERTAPAASTRASASRPTARRGIDGGTGPPRGPAARVRRQTL